jgi:cysteinyl-tRNA synthetase
MTATTTGLRLYNTKARAKQDFTPIDPSNLRMYVCGPTVYDRAHLGNARPVIVFDTLYRLLRHLYGPDHVTYVRNFTDVDDKINAEALRRQKAGAAGTLEDLIRERTEETIAWYHADMDALGALRPSIKGVVSDKAAPRATGYINEMIDMIKVLIEGKHAYVVRDNSNQPPQEYVLFDRASYEQGHALFDVESYSNYGKFSGRSLEDMIAGARSETAPHKRNPQDFVLWKPSSGEEPGWASPWGKGRPGWHIECSAMAHELLGESFDIHGGGLDLQFPHHENEIAQSACAHPHGDFAHYWMHNEMLQVEGKKMSKSLGNFFTVRDLLEGNTPDGVKYPGEVIRFVFLMTHYRSPMDWTAEKARQAKQTLRDWYSKTDGVDPDDSLKETFLVTLADDLNTHALLSEMHFFADSVEPYSAGVLKWAMNLVGFPEAEHVDWWRVKQSSVPGISYSGTREPPVDLLFALLRKWHDLRMDKKYQDADLLKKGIEAAGTVIRATANGPFANIPDVDDFDSAKLEALQ